MKRRKLIVGLVTLIALTAGCKTESKPDSKTNSVPSASTPVEEEPASRILSRLPKLEPNSDISGLKKMGALKENSKALKLRAQGNYDEAVDAFISALQHNPSNLAVRYNLAVTLLHLKKETDALTVLRQFQDTKNCNDCFLMLAKAKDDAPWGTLNTNAVFRKLVDGPAAKLDAALKSAKWVKFDEKALNDKKVAFSLNGLPAISKDGKRIAVAQLGHDSDGRITSLTIQILEPTTGERIHGQRIMFEEEGKRIYSERMSARDMSHHLKVRIEHFTKTMMSHEWEPLSFAVSGKNIPPSQCSVAQQITVNNQNVVFDYPQLSIKSPNGGSDYASNIAKWSESENKICSTTPFVRAIFLHAPSKTFLFELGYCSKTCIAPDGRWVSIRLE